MHPASSHHERSSPIRDTSDHPGKWIALTVFVVIMTAGFFSTWWAWYRDDVEIMPPVGASAWIDGKAFAAISQQLPKTPLPEGLAMGTRMLAWRVLNDLGPDVRSGCWSWLFLTEELTLTDDPIYWRLRQHEFAKKFATTLSELETQLLIVIIPDKSRILKDDLCGIYRPTVLNDRIEAWAKNLVAQGIPTLNLTTALAQQPQKNFLKADTHWNISGAKRSAEAISTIVRSLPLPGGVLDTEYWALEKPDQKIILGDLIRLAGLDRAPPDWRPAFDAVTLPTFTKVTTSSTDPAQLLLNEQPTVQIGLIGTSFSLTSGFTDWLKLALQTDIATFAREGAGFSGSVQKFMQSKPTRDSLKLIIWEIPERVLDRPFSLSDFEIMD